MRGRRNDEIGAVGVIHHQPPHVDGRNIIGQIVVAMNLGAMWEVNFMKKIQRHRDQRTKTPRNNILFAHIFAAVHNLDGGDVELVGQAKAGNRTTCFVVNVKNVKIFDFWMIAVNPFFYDGRATRDWRKPAKKEFTTRHWKDVALREFGSFFG